jgi:hypothetical protein
MKTKQLSAVTLSNLTQTSSRYSRGNNSTAEKKSFLKSQENFSVTEFFLDITTHPADHKTPSAGHIL